MKISLSKIQSISGKIEYLTTAGFINAKESERLLVLDSLKIIKEISLESEQNKVIVELEKSYNPIANNIVKIDIVRTHIPIKIEKEPKDLIKYFKQYELCFFCRKQTDTWNMETSKPICEKCSEKHTISELKNRILETSKK